jgi:hypothetical protein
MLWEERRGGFDSGFPSGAGAGTAENGGVYDGDVFDGDVCDDAGHAGHAGDDKSPSGRLGTSRLAEQLALAELELQCLVKAGHCCGGGFGFELAGAVRGRLEAAAGATGVGEAEGCWVRKLLGMVVEAPTTTTTTHGSPGGSGSGSANAISNANANMNAHSGIDSGIGIGSGSGRGADSRSGRSCLRSIEAALGAALFQNLRADVR